MAETFASCARAASRRELAAETSDSRALASVAVLPYSNRTRTSPDWTASPSAFGSSRMRPSSEAEIDQSPAVVGTTMPAPRAVSRSVC